MSKLTKEQLETLITMVKDYIWDSNLTMEQLDKADKLLLTLQAMLKELIR